MCTENFYILGDNSPLSWKELVELLKRKGKDYQSCKIPVDGEYDLINQLSNPSAHPYVDDGMAWILARWYSSGVVYMTFTLEDGDCGDEDGFGREDGITLVAIADEEGKIILPFTESESRTAQWKSFENGIEEPVFCEYDLYKEFKSGTRNLPESDDSDLITKDDILNILQKRRNIHPIY